MESKQGSSSGLIERLDGLSSILAQPARRQLTSAELVDVLGEPLPPCPACGSLGFGRLATGEILCAACRLSDLERADAASTIALWLWTMPGPDGLWRAREWPLRFDPPGTSDSIGRPLGEFLDELDRRGVGFALLADSTLAEGDGSRPPISGAQAVKTSLAGGCSSPPKRIILLGKLPTHRKRKAEETPQKGLF